MFYSPSFARSGCFRIANSFFFFFNTVINLGGRLGGRIVLVFYLKPVLYITFLNTLLALVMKHEDIIALKASISLR